MASSNPCIVAANNADTENNNNNNILPRRSVLYCGACGMPLEYCEYGPDFETHCNPWLKKHDAELFKTLARGGAPSAVAANAAGNKAAAAPPKPDKPWTIEERLTAFYNQYVPEKVDAIPGLLEKYAGKEEKLFQALVQKYGEEPDDPYYSESEADDDDDDDAKAAPQPAAAAAPGSGAQDAAAAAAVAGGNEDVAVAPPSASERKKRRGAAAKHGDAEEAMEKIRIVVQKVAQKKKRQLTIITGMESVPGLKLKDVSKIFSKKFAGSSSVKKTADGKGEEIIIQGDHVYDVAEMIVDHFKVPESAVFVDIGDGEIVPLR